MVFTPPGRATQPTARSPYPQPFGQRIPRHIPPEIRQERFFGRRQTAPISLAKTRKRRWMSRRRALAGLARPSARSVCRRLSSRKRWLSPPHPCTKRCRILRRPDIAPSASRLTRPGSPKGGENLSLLFLDVCAHSLSRPRVSYVGCARSSCLECLLELGAWCFQTSVPNMPGQPHTHV